MISSPGAVSSSDGQGVGSSALALTSERLARCDSYQRAHQLVLAMAGTRSPREQVSLFLEWANTCDAPWAYRSYFLDTLRRALREIPLREVLPPEERAWFDSMGPLVQVYRGCDAGRVRGLSWTTDIDVARDFAAGKRCVNRNPTLVSSLIPKEHVLALFLDRQEQEVTVDPRRLRQLEALSLNSRPRGGKLTSPVAK